MKSARSAHTTELATARHGELAQTAAPGGFLLQQAVNSATGTLEIQGLRVPQQCRHPPKIHPTSLRKLQNKNLERLCNLPLYDLAPPLWCEGAENGTLLAHGRLRAYWGFQSILFTPPITPNNLNRKSSRNAHPLLDIQLPQFVPPSFQSPKTYFAAQPDIELYWYTTNVLYYTWGLPETHPSDPIAV